MTIPREELNDRVRRFWDRDAATYDRSLGHGIEHPVAAAAWSAALARHLPSPPSSVLDVGAGTGAMSLIAADLGHRVTSLDISSGMLSHAERKAAERGLHLETVVGGADDPPPGPFHAVIERHLLWTLPDPADAMARWRAVAAPAGRLVLYEGRWGGRDVSVRSSARRRHARTAPTGRWIRPSRDVRRGHAVVAPAGGRRGRRRALGRNRPGGLESRSDRTPPRHRVGGPHRVSARAGLARDGTAFRHHRRRLMVPARLAARPRVIRRCSRPS